MATLYLNHVNRSFPPLREWLEGDRALLFSHPLDFQDYGLERDRWLDVLRSEFRVRGVRPIAYRDDGGEPERGWVSQLMGDDRRLLLTTHDTIDIAARQVRDEIARIPADRFVLLVDESLAPRAVVKYGSAPPAISVFDLLGLIDAMRRQSSPSKAYPQAA
jgi:hypothetical protein